MSFLDKWLAFEAKCVHPHTRGKNEVENMRRCFYAGATAMLAIMESVDLSSDSAMNTVKDVIVEMQEFAKEVAHGYPDEQQQPESASRGKKF